MSSPFTPPEADQEIAPPSSIELIWMNHRGALLGVIAMVVLLLLIVAGVLSSKHSAKIASETLLFSSTGEAGWAAVIAKYPRTPAAADAMLLLAASLRDGGRIEESDAIYSRFTETFASSPLAVSGLLGRASNARLAGKPDLALSVYQQAAAGFPQSYGAPYALFSEARLLAQQGRSDDVKRILQTLLSQYPASISAQTVGGSAGSTGN
jgi:tetratricopeptide (TPR) repeat protein